MEKHIGKEIANAALEAIRDSVIDQELAKIKNDFADLVIVEE